MISINLHDYGTDRQGTLNPVFLELIMLAKQETCRDQITKIK